MLFLFKKNIYVFWLCWVLVTTHSVFIVACGFLSCDLWDSFRLVGSKLGTHCIGTAESWPLTTQGSPYSKFLVKELEDGKSLVSPSLSSYITSLLVLEIPLCIFACTGTWLLHGASSSLLSGVLLS